MGVDELRSQIKELRKKLNDLIQQYGDELSHQAILDTSHDLDELIAEYSRLLCHAKK
ncbi:MAG: aspartyl-phosphate phosphatase Spo0E family protein [Clostridia bacterium]